MFPWVKRRAVLFVIPGGSGGFPSINLDLYRDSRAFRESIECTGAVIEEMLGWSAAAAFRGEQQPPYAPEIERRNEIVHHGMTRIALIDQWRADGIEPDGAVGVSLGELIAPYAVGAISREECARLVAVTAHAVTHTPSAFRTYVVAVDGETARRLCRNAPVPVDFLGTSSHDLSLVLCSENESDIVRNHFGDAIVKDAPSGWRYHTPWMHWDRQWAHEQLGSGIALRPVQRPIYSPAVGGLLPLDSRFDAQLVRWMMSGPSYFANAVSAALADGFDTIVLMTARPMHVFADVVKTAEAEGRSVRQFHAFDAKARKKVRALKRRPVTPAVPTAAAMPEISSSAARDLETERLSARLLQPLVEGVPFDVVSALADPIADAVTVDRDQLRRALASSVLLLLRDPSVRQRVTENPELVGEIAPANDTAVAALRTLLRLAPDFGAFQPLNTVQLVNGETLQLVIAR